MPHGPVRPAVVVGAIAAAVAFALESPPARASICDGPSGAASCAIRATGSVSIDGHLDEDAWAGAPATCDLVQIFPAEGEPPTKATEIRVLYDDEMLYVGVRCFDAAAAEIMRPLGRRDSIPESDQVEVFIAPSAAGRNAGLFVVSAGGVQADAWVYDDDRFDYDWDAVWEGAASVQSDGWSAEFAIPLSVVRYRPKHALGFGVQRRVGRSHERSATMLLPRNERGIVSRVGILTGIERVEPGADVTLSPFAAQRLVFRPRSSDPTQPSPRMHEPISQIGADLRWRVADRWTISGAVNPDFGQVEADQIILNLTNSELFLPEKRPFFYEGLDLFKPVGSGEASQPHHLLYSRRIGLAAPIWGAAKVLWQPGDAVEVGLLNAVIAGRDRETSATEEDPDRRLRWDWRHPFTLAPGSADPAVAPPTVNMFAGVARWKAASGLTVGLQTTSAFPIAEPCTEADLQVPGGPPSQCTTIGGNAAALSLEATSKDRSWYAYGQASASQAIAGPPQRILADGTELSRGDLGAGAYAHAGKRGGEPWRFDVYGVYATPRLDLNAVGYQDQQNLLQAGATLTYARPIGNELFHEYTLWVEGSAQWTADQPRLDRQRLITVGVNGLLKSFHLRGQCRWMAGDLGFDLREISGAGIPFEMSPFLQSICSIETDPAATFSFTAGPWIGRMFGGHLGDAWTYGVDASVRWQPHPRVETRLNAIVDLTEAPARYIGGDGQEAPLLFGGLRAHTMSWVLRQTVVLTTTLTAQLYGQLFSGYGDFGPLYTAATSQGWVLRSDLQPVDGLPPGFSDPTFHDSRLVLNATARWEFRPGSLLWLMYFRNQAELPMPIADGGSLSLGPRLGSGPTVDGVFLKFVYLFQL